MTRLRFDAAAIVAASTVLSKLTGLLRIGLVTIALGATTNLGNAYDVALKLPTVLAVVLSTGVFNAALVPYLVRLGRSLNRSINTRTTLNPVGDIILLSLIVIGVLTLLGTIFAGSLVTAYAGVTNGPIADLAIAIAYFAMPQLFFLGLYAVVSQVLQANDSYGWSSIAPSLANVISLVGLIPFLATGQADSLSASSPLLIVLGLSSTIGVAAQAALVLIPALSKRLIPRPTWKIRGWGMRALAGASMWSLMSLLANQATFLLITRAAVLASSTPGEGLVAGSAAYTLAQTITYVPHVVFVVALSQVMFTAVSRLDASRDSSKIGLESTTQLRTATLVGFASLIFFLIASHSIVMLLNPRAGGDLDSVTLTVVATAAGAVTMSRQYLLIRVLWSQQLNRVAFLLTLASLVPLWVAIGLIASLAPPWLMLPLICTAQAFSFSILGSISKFYLRYKMNITIGGLGTRSRLALFLLLFIAVGLGLVSGLTEPRPLYQLIWIAGSGLPAGIFMLMQFGKAKRGSPS